MALRTRPARAYAARPRSPAAKILAAAVFCLTGYAVMIGGAQAPAYGEVQMPVAAAPAATLTYSGDKVVITGSVDNLFKTAEFTGPNRVLKQDRARINVDALALTKSFEQTRIRMAAAAAAKDPAKAKSSDPYVAVMPRPIEVASIDPASSEALRAIDSSVPMPAAQSGQLAYAREMAPVTSFDTAPAESKYSERDLWCMAQAVYFESRGESYRGQVAVAQVVMNRLKHRLYPKTICGVVFQGEERRNACQFSFACDGIPETINDQKSWAQAQEIARKVTDGELYLTEVANATHYHASYVYPDWAPRLKRVTKIGLHVFYRFKTRAG